MNETSQSLRRYLILTAVLILSLTLLPAASAASPLAAATGLAATSERSAPHQSDLVVTRSDETGVELLLQVGEPRLLPVEAGGASFLQVSLDGYGSMGEAGWPALPERGVLIGLPAGASPTVTILQQSWQAVAEQVLPLPAATLIAENQGQEDPLLLEGPRSSRVANPVAYDLQAERWPAQPVHLGEVAWLRSLQVVPVYLRPMRWDAASGRLDVVRRLRIRIDFRSVQPLPLARPTPPDRFFEPLLQDSVLNFQVAQAWTQPGRALSEPVSAWRPDPSQPWLKIGVTETGMVQITPADLAAAGFDLAGSNPDRLQLWDEGQQIALIYLGDPSDGAFDGDDRLVWYGQRSSTRYTSENIYWLTVGISPGLRAAQVDGTPSGAPSADHHQATVHLEDNTTYIYDVPWGQISDRWYGDRLTAGPQPSQVMSFQADHLAGGPASLEVRMLGTSFQAAVNPDHHVEVSVNGTQVGQLSWDGPIVVTATFALDPGVLVEGNNTVLIHLPGDTGAAVEVSHVDWVRVSYRRQFVLPTHGLYWHEPAGGARSYAVQGLPQADALLVDTTDPWTLQQVTGLQFQPTGSQWQARFRRAGSSPRQSALVTLDQLLSPSRLEVDVAFDWSAAQAGADYLAISHQDFLNETQRLLAWRQAQGMRTALFDVQELYDAYSDGQMDAQAIRDFLVDSYQNWPQPAPAFVVLVGSGHYDFQNFLGLANPRQIFIPPFLGCWDPWLCEVASDNRLVTIDGQDPLADMLIGRLPVESVGQARTVVDKILGYEQAPPSGAWQQQVLFVSDNDRSGTGQPDPAGSFEVLTEAAIALLPPGYEATRVFYDPYPTDDAGEPYRYRTPLATTTAILREVNQGNLVVNYVGHAGITAWAHEWLLRSSYSGRDDIALMSNGNQLAVGLSMGCLSGTFAHPQFRSLDAGMVVWPNGGTVASWGATGFGVATGHDWLHQGFYEAIFDLGLTRLGMATQLSKIDLYTNSLSHHDLIDTFSLLGDPATQMPLAPDLSVEHTPPAGPLAPGDWLTYTVGIRNQGGLLYGPGVVLALDLPRLQGVSTISSGFSAVAGDHDGQWILGPLPEGLDGELTLSGQLPLDLAADELPLAVRARLTNAWADRDLTNNQTPWAEVAPLAADLGLDWHTNHSLVLPGAPISLTLVYSNAGPAPASGNHLTLTLPAELLDPELTGSAVTANPQAGSVITWTVPLLLPGEIHSVILSGTVDALSGGLGLSFLAQGRTAWLDAGAGNDQASLDLLFALPDLYEPDNSPAEATPLAMPDLSASHTAHRLDDRDWYSFQARRGVTYHVRVQNLSQGGDTVLTLYGGDGNFVAKNDDYTPGVRWSGLDWLAPRDGVFYLMVNGWSDNATGYSYDLAIWATHRRFLPQARIASGTR